MGIIRMLLATVVTLGMLSVQNIENLDENGIPDGYYAIIHGGVGEMTHETYVYATDRGYRYVNVTSTTVSWGSPQWNHRVDKRGTADTREEIAKIAQKHGANGYVTYPYERNKTHTIEEFLEGVPPLSEHYLIGLDLGGSSWGEYYDCISASLIITTDRKVLIHMPTKVEGYNATEAGLIATLELTEKQYDNIVRAVDAERLFTLDPKEDKGVCDGYGTYLTLYGTDDSVLKNCGGYMTSNQYLITTFRTICNNLPVDEILEIRKGQIEKLKSQEMQGR